MQDKGYTLATGDSGAYRLEILNAIHQPYTDFLLERAGLSKGMRVADIGCGTGNVSFLMASKVKINGSVCGVDISRGQLDIARSQAEILNLDNVTFSQGSAYDTKLPKESFDLVYCRFLLIHLNRPIDALIEMRSPLGAVHRYLSQVDCLSVKKQILVKLSANHFLKVTTVVMKC